jgi:hypothetical protein
MAVDKQEPAQEPESLRDAVFTVLEGFTLPQDARKILEAAYYTEPPAQEPVLALAPGYCKNCKDYTIEEPLYAQPEQEPVAWTTMPDAADWDFVSGSKDPNGKLDGKWVPLYTTTPAQSAQEPAEWLTGCPTCGMDSGCDCDTGTWNPPKPEQEPTSGDYALGYAEGFNDACKKPAQEPGPSGDYLRDFSDEQWWVAELEATVVKGTLDQKRAVAVVRNLLATVAANIQAPPAAQPAQEPVVYIRKDQLQKAMQSAMLCEVTSEPRQDRVRIYTAPPKREWVGLTDEAIKAMDAGATSNSSFYAGALWAETKLKEKNT